MRSRTFSPVLIFMITALAACNPVGQIKEMFDLRNAVRDKYHCDDVAIQITNDSMAVTITNSAYSDSSNATKLRMATEIAAMGKQYIKSPITTGTLSFKDEHHYVGINRSNVTNFQMFPARK